MSRYKPPSVLQAMKVILSAHQDLEGIFRNLDSELAEAKEVSKALDEAINCIKGHNLREPEHEPLRKSLVAISSAANTELVVIGGGLAGSDAAWPFSEALHPFDRTDAPTGGSICFEIAGTMERDSHVHQSALSVAAGDVDFTIEYGGAFTHAQQIQRARA